MSGQPPLKGLDSTVDHVQKCRLEAVRELQEHGSPSATLKATYYSIQIEQPDPLQSLTSPLYYLRCTQAISAAVGAVKSRSVSFAGAIHCGVTDRKLLILMHTDLMKSCLRVFVSSAL